MNYYEICTWLNKSKCETGPIPEYYINGHIFTRKEKLNFLAHYYLARTDEGLIVGNLLADHVKGRRYLDLPQAYRRGVILHRKIDEYTDHHPEVMKTKERLMPVYGKFAPVIADVFYDYFLGSRWSDYSGLELSKFSAYIYSVLNAHIDFLPESAQITLSYMSRHDWLTNYSNYFGIGMALKGLARRSVFENKMDKAIEDLKRDENAIEKEFKAFFRDLEAEVGIVLTGI